MLSLVHFLHQISLLHYADKRITVTITLYSHLLLQSVRFNAISPTDWAPKSSPTMPAYLLDSSRCSCLTAASQYTASIIKCNTIKLYYPMKGNLYAASVDIIK